MAYDWPSGRYRLTVRVKRHGSIEWQKETVDGLSVEDVEEHLAVVLSSFGRDGSTEQWAF